MLKKLMLLIWILCLLILSHFLNAGTQNFKVEKIGDRILMLTDPEDGAKQLAVATQKGVTRCVNRNFALVASQWQNSPLTKGGGLKSRGDLEDGTNHRTINLQL